MSDTVMIGGPADGQRVSGKVMPQRVFQETPGPMHLTDTRSFNRHLYVAEILRSGDEVFHFYRHERLSVPMALALLLQGYKP